MASRHIGQNGKPDEPCLMTPFCSHIFWMSVGMHLLSDMTEGNPRSQRYWVHLSRRLHTDIHPGSIPVPFSAALMCRIRNAFLVKRRGSDEEECCLIIAPHVSAGEVGMHLQRRAMMRDRNQRPSEEGSSPTNRGVSSHVLRTSI